MERRRIRVHSQSTATPELPGVPRPTPPVAPGPARAARVQVSWGALTREVDVQSMTVDEAYRTLRDPLGLAPRCEALVNGRRVDGSHVLEAGDRLELIRASGEKG